MRLHSDILTVDDINDALRDAVEKGKVDREVMFETLLCKGSRTRKNGFEVQLGWYGDKVPGDGRRYKNGGNIGAGVVYAATYDEWGWFIAELYKLDPNLVFGHYKTRQVFNDMTKNAYR